MGISEGNMAEDSAPKNLISGMMQSHEIILPVSMALDILIPIIKPTPIRDGRISTPSMAPENPLIADSTLSGKSLRPFWAKRYSPATPIAVKRVLAEPPPTSPATSTSAQAVPSGKGSFPCSSTITARLRGIIIRSPRVPPRPAIRVTVISFGASPNMYRAGMVKITPAAIDSPAEPMVCTMLFSRMVPRLRSPLRIPIEITAAGIEAETVIPTFKPR